MALPFRRFSSYVPQPVRRLVRRVQSSCAMLGVRVSRWVHPPPWPRNPNGAVYLNLGCGTITHPAFLNVDALVARHIHYIRPIDDLRPFRDDSVDLVYASHCLEHFSHREVARVVAEWHRVLKPGGILRVGVPDFDQLIAMYEYSGRDIGAIQQILMGGHTYPLNRHYVVFTERSLTQLFRKVGFAEVRTWHWGSDELASLPDYTRLKVKVRDREFSISLNLEAIK